MLALPSLVDSSIVDTFAFTQRPETILQYHFNVSCRLHSNVIIFRASGSPVSRTCVLLHSPSSSFYVKVPAKTYFDFTWCQGNGNGLAITYTDADTIAAPAGDVVPSNLPLCRKPDDLRAAVYDYQFLANDMPRAVEGVNSSDSYCSQPKLFPTTCYNQDALVFLSFANYWSGKFENGTLYPSSWYGTSRGRDINITLTPATNDKACVDVGAFTTVTKVTTATRRMPSPIIEGEEAPGATITSAPSAAAVTTRAAGTQTAAAVADTAKTTSSTGSGAGSLAASTAMVGLTTLGALAVMLIAM